MTPEGHLRRRLLQGLWIFLRLTHCRLIDYFSLIDQCSDLHLRDIAISLPQTPIDSLLCLIESRTCTTEHRTSRQAGEAPGEPGLDLPDHLQAGAGVEHRSPTRDAGTGFGMDGRQVEPPGSVLKRTCVQRTP